MSKIIEIEDSYILNDDYDVDFYINKNNFKFVDTTYETDTYYVDKKGTFIDKRICLRTRKTNDEKLELTYKPETNDETEKYGKKEVNISLCIDDGKDINFILNELGYNKYIEFTKKRTTYTKYYDGAEYNIMIDEINEVGRFIELEIITDEEHQVYYAKKLDKLVEDFDCKKLKPKNAPYRDIVINSKIK